MPDEVRMITVLSGTLWVAIGPIARKFANLVDDPRKRERIESEARRHEGVKS